MSNDPVVAIVGVTGAVGAEFIATMDKRGFRVGKLKALASARSAGKTVVVPRARRRHRGADRARLRGRRHRAVLRRRRHLQEVRARSRSRPARSSSTTPPPSAWTRTCRWWSPRSTPNRIRDHKGIIANPNCAADHRAGAALADPPEEPHQARDRLDLPGGLAAPARPRWTSWSSPPAPISTGRPIRRR